MNTPEKFDVAIIGVGVGANYGSVLTYYSLYKVIESFGKKVLMVSKIGASKNDPEMNDSHSIRFAKTNYNLSKTYNLNNVSDLNNIADTFVIGSDQVWNYGISRNFGKAFYLDFATDDKRKLSYAASFGHGKDFAPDEERPVISALLQRFDAISVREDNAVALARKVYNVAATQVAEPIFLSDVQTYLDLAERATDRDVSGDYLLAYILDPTPEKTEAIKHVAAKLGLRIRVILDGWANLFEENKEKIGLDGCVEHNVEVYDFLKLYANCRYVLTDSFHGTAFALKFQKPFASIGNRRRGMVRFDSMFRVIKNDDRFTVDANDIIRNDSKFLSDVDYRPITKALDEHVENSVKWLRDALEAPIGALKKSEGVLAAVSSRLVSNVLKKEKTVLRPDFTPGNTAWKVTPAQDATRLDVAEGGAVRGNFVWCDLPMMPVNGQAYRLTITWSVRTKASTINLHTFNAAAGKYHVAGGVRVGGKVNVKRVDSVDFIASADGMPQFMLGAFHFSGPSAGAEIFSISMEIIRREDVRTAVETKKKPAEVARELAQIDNDRFINAYAQNRVSRNEGNARALMMYHSHGIEKGLSHKQFRPGFGATAIQGLSVEMNKWLKSGHDASDSFFQIAAAVMRSYFARHKALDVDVSTFWKLFDKKVQDAISSADESKGGALVARAERELKAENGSNRGFLDVVFARRSVREFLAVPVSDDDISRAINIAQQSPSVCNRQPVRVHMFTDPSTIAKALELQGGFRGYKASPRLLLVTADNTAFVAAVERNQAYIDGGLFAMMLLLGLENVGLGGCPLNTMLNSERESALRKLLGIPSHEVFITFIAVGHFDPDVLTPRSTRLPQSEILTTHE